MPFFSAFGGCLRSEVDMPDLPASRSRTPTWDLRVGEGPPPPSTLELLGEHETGRGGVYRLFRTGEGLRLQWLDRYVFDVRAQGTEITWYPADDTRDELVRALVLGPVLALAHHLSGSLCLHGSAVAVGRQGIGFLAAKYHGKSTLGCALTLAGARHLSDDALVVDFGAEVQVRPGVHSFRLWNDSAGRLGAADLDCVVMSGVKNTLTALPRRLVQRDPVPLAALYVLRSIPPVEEVAAAQRVQLSPSQAAAALSHHTKLPQLLVGREEGVPQFLRAASIARSVPVFDLQVVRDFDRLPEVVETILGWHRATRRRSRRSLATA